MINLNTIKYIVIVLCSIYKSWFNMIKVQTQQINHYIISCYQYIKGFSNYCFYLEFELLGFWCMGNLPSTSKRFKTAVKKWRIFFKLSGTFFKSLYGGGSYYLFPLKYCQLAQVTGREVYSGEHFMTFWANCCLSLLGLLIYNVCQPP